MKKFFALLSILQVDMCVLGLFLMFIFFLAFFGGCVNSINPEVSSSDRGIIDKTEESWKMAFYSSSYDENCLDNVGVVTLSKDNFQLTCGKPAFFSVGCVQDRGGYRRGKVLYLSPAVHPNKRDYALIHVTLHALAGCSVKKGSRDPNDELHMRPDIWIEVNQQRSLEYRIRGGLSHE